MRSRGLDTGPLAICDKQHSANYLFLKTSRQPLFSFGLSLGTPSRCSTEMLSTQLI